MAKYSGVIGFGTTVETKPGVYKNIFIERQVFGDIYKDTKRSDKTEHLNDDISVNNIISFLADPYAHQHFHLIKYASYSGIRWKVTSVAVEFPRLLLTLGGVYND